MSDQPQTAPILTVTWDTVIGTRAVGEQEHDTGYQDYEDISLGDAVVNALASQLQATVRRDAEQIRQQALRDLRNNIDKVVTQVAREEIQAIVREVLAGEIRQTNEWGETRGESASLRTLMVKLAKEYLTEPTVNQYGNRADAHKGGLRELLRTEVDEALTKELRAAVAEGRALVAEKVRDRAAELFGDVVKQATR